jgi:ATP-dependent metalloprotease FtsH
MHDDSTEVFLWAKRAAIGAGAERLGVLDLLCGLRSAAEGDGEHATRVRASLQAVGLGERWPAAVDARRAASPEVPADTARGRKFALEPALRDVIDAAHAVDRELPLSALLTALVASADPLVAECFADAPRGGRAPSRTADVLRAHLDASHRLAESLRARVFGQDPAIRMLAQAYFQASLRPAVGGPRGIFTFLGPPGVGKTLLAESFAEGVAALGDDECPFRRFDMSAFAGHQSFEQLFGAARFYSGARPGTLTGFVHDNPRCVLLFDEIEKAHLNTIQSLLAILDKGTIEDKALEKPVDFSKAWIVFTTNLGRELFDADNASGILRDARLSSAAVFDVLAHARGRHEQGTAESSPALPPEFVSRLAKGGAVLFDRLRTRDYLRIVDAAFAATCATKAGAPQLPQVDAEEDAKLALLLSTLPDVDARRLSSRAASWAAEAIERSFEEHGAAITASARDGYPIHLKCAPATRALVREGADLPPLEVLLIDDDAFLEDALARGVSRVRIAVTRVSSREDVLAHLARHGADLVLLDLSIGEGAASANTESALELLANLRGRRPALPVLLFSENPDARAGFEGMVARAMALGGARGFLPCRRAAATDVLVEDFVAAVQRHLEDVRDDLVLRRYTRARRQLTFDTVYRWDAADRRVVGELRHARELVVTRADDESAAVRFSGIPRERFSDLIGVERAKRRLRDVAGWLRHPEKLASFGVTPPRGLLLAGPPGTGKTSLARALAGEAGLPFLALSSGELRSKWHGESEERLRELFQRARRYAPSIVFIDEIDTIGRARGDGQHGSDTALLNQLLTCLDGFDAAAPTVFVLAATNLPELLDPALTRPGRLDETVPIDVPGAAARRAFFELRLAAIRTAPLGDVLGRLVSGTSGCSPADLDRLVREAAYRAASDGRDEVTADDLERARRAIRYGAGREGAPIAPEDLRLTAAHEAAHALVHLVGDPRAKLEHVSIVPTERGALGFVAPLGDETRVSVSRTDLRHQIAVALAGREGEALLTASLDQVTSGASSDLRRATTLAARAVGDWGLDDEMGAIALSALPEGMRDAASALAMKRVRAWLDEGRARAQGLLREHRAAWERLTEALLREEEIDGVKVAELVRGG